jgi:hypothetical protein
MKKRKVILMGTLVAVALMVVACKLSNDRGKNADVVAAEAFQTDYSEVLKLTVITVTAANETAVNDALAAFAELSEDAQDLLEDEKALLDALKAKIIQLKAAAASAADNAAADAWKTDEETAVVLGETVSTVTVDDEEAIDAAISAYNALSDAQKALLTTEKAKLDSLKTRIDQLKTEAAAEEANLEVANDWKTDEATAAVLGETVSTVTVDDEEAIDAAIAAYDALSDAQKALLTTEKAKLNSLKTRIEQLKTDAETAAANLAAANTWKTTHTGILAKTTGTVALGDETALNAALVAYDELGEAVKALVVTEKSLLDGLQAKIAELKILTGEVSINGNAIVGSVLTANTDDLDGSGTISYQWLWDGTINIGSNSSTYTLTSDDLGHTISVRVTRLDNTGNVTSDSTDTVVNPTGGITVGSGITGDDFPGDANVSTNRITLDISADQTATITVSGNTTAVDWWLDGVLLSTVENTKSLTFNAAYVKVNATDITLGTHTVTVTVTIDGVRYSKYVTLTAVE